MQTTVKKRGKRSIVILYILHQIIKKTIVFVMKAKKNKVCKPVTDPFEKKSIVCETKHV